MPTVNAPYYSCKAGRPDVIKSHRKREAAIRNAGECGQIWDTEQARQYTVHEMADGTWKACSPNDLSADLSAALYSSGLVKE
jgi:hypothetical protein